MARKKRKLTRREFLGQSAATAAALAVGAAAPQIFASTKQRAAPGPDKRVVVIGMDGMDPRLSEKMMKGGLLPHFDSLRRKGGYGRLGTSTPPQSPVAWANFINGAGPGTHGIFDFIHRNPNDLSAPFFAAAETLPGQGYWELQDHRLQLDFWPFGHQPPTTVLRRQGIPFWDYLDESGIESQFYDLPSNYPPSASKHGHHKSLSGLGTPDMLGTYGTYQHFSEDGPLRRKDEPGGKRSMIFFENETSNPDPQLLGPRNRFLKKPTRVLADFTVHRDMAARAVVIEIQNRKILLKEGQWSRWYKVDFELTMPGFVPNKALSGICRFYLQEVTPNLRLYVSPINIDPSDPATRISEPGDFVKDISKELGLFYTAGFQEDHKALSNKVFTEDEFIVQAGMVLEERLRLLNYAMEHYDDGLLFFYFSSTDLQAHMFWWDTDEKHPVRSAAAAGKYYDHLKSIYRKMDDVLGEILRRYGEKATVIVMSDHGFANFKRQFALNAWLRENGFIQPANASSIFGDLDWSKTKAYGLGINALYLNLKGREREGIVDPGTQRDKLIEELIAKLEAVRDVGNRRVIRKVHRADQTYSGPAAKLAPDLVVGYSSGYRASWSTCLGGMDEEVLSDNESAWSADHCADPSEVPGVIFSNRPIAAREPSLVDVAPSILERFGLKVPSSMAGKNIF